MAATLAASVVRATRSTSFAATVRVNAIAVRAFAADAAAAAAAKPTKPKKPVTGYLAFHLDVRKKLAADGTKLSIGDTMRQVAARWKALSDEEKKKYQPTTEEEIKAHDEAMASYKAALSAFTAARETATQERKKKLNAKRSRAVSAYTLFYNEQFDATKAELGTPKELGNVARSIASKWKALSDDQKTAYRTRASEATAQKRASLGH